MVLSLDFPDHCGLSYLFLRKQRKLGLGQGLETTIKNLTSISFNILTSLGMQIVGKKTTHQDPDLSGR